MRMDLVRQVALEGVLEAARLTQTFEHSFDLERLKKVVVTLQAVTKALEGLLALAIANGFKDAVNGDELGGNGNV